MIIRSVIALIILCGLGIPSSYADRITIASSNYYPHYGENLPQQGVVTEIIRQAFALQGIETDITFMPFARAYRETQLGNYTALSAAWYHDSRTQYFLYSQPMYANHIVFFKHKDQSITYRDFTDLKQQRYRLAVVQGYSQPEGLLESGINTEKVASDEQMFQMLALGRVDLVVADRLNGLYLLQQNLPQYADKLEWMRPILETRPMYLLLSKQDPRSEELMQQFNRGLQQLQQSGQYQQIIQSMLPQYRANKS
ncbi:transporter substrate-binding domain-containing protein [Chromatiaceae bacterium AAb-1]|nr:transporter substrate-binding domain-containing protein [Chromatiaceae bacterium AAb-1]